MPNSYRNESLRRSPPGKYGTPGTQYPTPNPYDIVLTEEVTNRAQAFEPVLYGTPHPTVPDAVLCHQGDVRGNNSDKAPVRVYATPRLAQEPYNLVNGGSEANDPAFPVFVRSYLLPRGYSKATPGSALTALIGLTLTSGGTGYAAGNDSPGYGKVALSFSGGSGSGAAGFAECAAGVIVAVVLTNTGTGYASAPSVSVSGGSGATITALLQPTTALLTKEDETPAEEPYGGYFVRVSRTWETLPGRAITTTRLDDDGVTVTVTRQRVVLASIVTQEDVSAGVWTRKYKGDGDSVSAEQITELRAIPGNPLTATKYDPESDTVYTEVRTRALLSAISEGGSIVSNKAITIESEPISELVGWEIKKTFPDATANDLTHAITISEESAPYQFPATIDVVRYFSTGGLIGYTKGFVRRVPHLTKVFWVVNSTHPSLADYVTPPAPSSIYNFLLNGDPLGEVIYDAIDMLYPGTSTLVHYPGSTPGLTAYKAGWVDQLKPVLGSVKEAGSRFRWRVEVTFVTMLLPGLPTYS